MFADRGNPLFPGSLGAGYDPEPPGVSDDELWSRRFPLASGEGTPAQVQSSAFRREGTLLVGELENALLIMPTQLLLTPDAVAVFNADLRQYSGRKPNIVIELSEQKSLSLSAILALIDFHDEPGNAVRDPVSGEFPRIIISTSDLSTQARLAQLAPNCDWTVVHSSEEALKLIEGQQIGKGQNASHGV